MKTVKVRVAVAVDEGGRWNADGYVDFDEAMAMRQARLSGDVPGKSIAFYWLTAELPVPEVQEVAAEVEKVK